MTGPKTRRHIPWTRWAIVILLLLIPTVYFGGPPIMEQIWFHQHSFVWTPTPTKCGEHTVYSASVRTLESGTFECSDTGIRLEANGEVYQIRMDVDTDGYLFWGFFDSLSCKGDWQFKKLVSLGYVAKPQHAFMTCRKPGLVMHASYLGP